MTLVYFFLLSTVGGILGILLRIPAGALIGPMFLVGTFKSMNILSIEQIPVWISWSSQALLGLMLGLSFTKESLKVSKNKLLGILIVGVFSLISSLIGAFIYATTNLSLLTSIISAIPGGFAEMLALSSSVNANTQAVAIFHITRVILLLLVVPNLVKWLYEKQKKRKMENEKDM